MQTYSHWLITAVLPTSSPRRKQALRAGSVSPDVPLALLSAGYVLDRRYLRPHLPDKTRCSPTYNNLYFNNPWWIAAHNLLHAPLPLFFLGLMGYLWRQRAWGEWLLWFATGCGLHSAIDILTHADDGPVLFFPLEWHKRFRSPISYWDPAHGGRIFRLAEHVLDFGLVVWLVLQRKNGNN
ncbi:MAG: metal-dependent hydrolase [Ardenticatenaceae bacterium]|nr:metal-dependent hydrolase [Ardenticatenaceae bacterium]